MTDPTADISATSDVTRPHHRNEPLDFHPGFTAIISFGAAMLLVIIYLYYDNALSCVKTICFRRRPPNTTTSDTTTEETGLKPKITNGGNIVNKDELSQTLIREPGVVCECGQIHLLRDCVKDEDLKPFEDLFNINCTRMFPQTTKCEVINESTNNLKNAIKCATIANGDDHLDRQNAQSSATLTLHETESVWGGFPQTDSGGSSPRCVSPLITVKPVKQANQHTKLYTYTGARPKERRLNEVVS